MEKQIIECTWRDYERFVQYCSIDVKMFGRGNCWRFADDSGFVGYEFAYRNNHIRHEKFELGRLSRREQMQFINSNIRQLSRIMIRPAFRKQGLAEQLIKYSLAKMPFKVIECLAANEEISRLLIRCGFSRHRLINDLPPFYHWFSSQAIVASTPPLVVPLV